MLNICINTFGWNQSNMLRYCKGSKKGQLIVSHIFLKFDDSPELHLQVIQWCQQSLFQCSVDHLLQSSKWPRARISVTSSFLCLWLWYSTEPLHIYNLSVSYQSMFCIFGDIPTTLHHHLVYNIEYWAQKEDLINSHWYTVDSQFLKFPFLRSPWYLELAMQSWLNPCTLELHWQYLLFYETSIPGFIKIVFQSCYNYLASIPRSQRVKKLFIWL